MKGATIFTLNLKNTLSVVQVQYEIKTSFYASLFLTRGYAKRRNGFLLGLRYANVSLAHSGVESS